MPGVHGHKSCVIFHIILKEDFGCCYRTKHIFYRLFIIISWNKNKSIRIGKSLQILWAGASIVTVQPFIYYIRKPASELSVAALQLMFTHFRNERLFYHKKVLNNTMNKLIVLPIIFLWLNCYQTAKSITKKSSICHIRVLYLEGSVLLFTRKHISFQPMNLWVDFTLD